jgi:hypothetical protein
MSVLGASTPIVDWKTLGEVVLYSLGAGVGVALCFALAILGSIRAAELRRGGAAAGAVGYAVLAALGLLATVGAAVLGIVVMTTKG